MQEQLGSRGSWRNWQDLQASVRNPVYPSRKHLEGDVPGTVGCKPVPALLAKGQRASYSTNASKFLICKMATTGLAHDRDAGKMTGDDVHRALRRVPGWSKESVNANHEYNQLATPSHSAAEHITLSQAPGFAPAVPSTWNTISHLA